MRLLCNENVPLVLVQALRKLDHDVFWIRSERPGIGDPEVLALAVQDSRICVTFDKDFGELAANAVNANLQGIILLRVTPSSGEEWANSLAKLISSRSDWAGHFSVIEPGRIRLRQLPMQQ